MSNDLELLKEPKFKKTPRERKQEKAFGKEPTDLGLPMMGLISMGMTAASGAAYDKAKKLEKKYKKEAEKKYKKETKNKEEKKVEVKREEKFMGGLVRSGKPKLAKKGWK